ncbi:MAG TPA: protein translocase subunit SecF [Gammaproteobacteria bacterium]|nr:protein translocase subunit SecF [Gammaproteobacteria bacterium]
MEFFKANTKIDFMGQRKWAALFSAILFIASIVSLAANHLNFGLDFTGGTQIELQYPQAADFNAIRQNLVKAGFDQAQVQSYGTSRDVLIRIPPHKEFTEQALRDKLTAALPGAKVQQIEYIGPQVGRSLVTNGLLAILVSLLATMAYIAFRFEMRFAISAAVALIHDPILILGIFSFFHLQFDLISLAAVLTIIGYSLNDTIVVYDRVRENFRRVRKGTPTEVMNLSINQTLSRTIMTSGLTLLVVVALFIFGGATLHGFSLALIIGIIIGTYSSIYVAGSLAISLGLNRSHLLPQAKKELDSLP